MQSTTQLLIVHLTDAHIKNSKSIGCRRIEKLSVSLGKLIEPATEVLLLFSGDIAFSGQKAEYDAANESIDKLRKELLGRGVVEVHVMTAPGNHDCDFDAIPESVRAAIIASPEFEGQSPEALVSALAPTQQKYFEFAKSQAAPSYTWVNDILHSSMIEVGEKNILLTSLNTAITSSLHEKPGTLRMPAKLLEEVSGEADICIVLAHHPLNWFNPKDSLSVSEWIDHSADIILLGHEHRVDDYLQSRKRANSTVNYLIGLPLEDKSDQCGIRCILIDLSKLSSVEYEGRFELTGETCSPNEVGEGLLCRNSARDHGTLHFSEGHRAFLIDPGAGFTHPRVNRAVELDDIFVPAEFRSLESDKKVGEHVNATVLQRELSNTICKDEGRTLVFGAEQTGKTAFAKKVILEARSRRLIPIYLDVSDLRSLNRGEIRGWYNSAINSQFDSDCRHLVEQSLPSEILIIIDNAHSIPGGAEGIDSILDYIGVKSRRNLVLTSENPAVSILSAQGEEEYKYWRSTKILELLPLGHRRRGELIRKWVSLGREDTESVEDIEAEVRQVKQLLDRALGKSSFPKYPLFIIAMLQQLEGLKTNKVSVANGSHGYLFEALVNQSIDRHVRVHEIGPVTDFLSALAWRVWERKGSPVSRAAIDIQIKLFRDGFVEINGEMLLKELIDARILLKEGNLYRFRYQYIYYYYLAKWLLSHSADEFGVKFLTELTPLIHTELSSNVLTFLAHFGKEQMVIDSLVPLLDSLFADQRPCELQMRSGLSLRYSTAKQRAVLLQGPPASVSDAHNDGLDEGESGQDEALHVEDSLKLNTTLKTLHVLGQVLKSRATSISPEEMVRVSEATMLSARRFMSFAYSLIEENAEAMVHGLSDAFERSFKLSKPKAVEIANTLLGAIVLSVARLGIIRAADTMGSHELRPLLEHLRREHQDPDTILILLVAKIIGDRNYPKEEVEDFVRGLDGANVLPIGVLAAAVARRFYLDPPDRSTREGACELLGIDVKNLPPSSRKSELYSGRRK